MNDLLLDLHKAIALLRKHGAVPSRVEITRAQYEELKKLTPVTLERPQPDRIFGIQVVVKD